MISAIWSWFSLVRLGRPGTALSSLSGASCGSSSAASARLYCLLLSRSSCARSSTLLSAASCYCNKWLNSSLSAKACSDDLAADTSGAFEVCWGTLNNGTVVRCVTFLRLRPALSMKVTSAELLVGRSDNNDWALFMLSDPTPAVAARCL
jgi:hypothetical protein